MGMWSAGAFGNDTAMDTIDDLLKGTHKRLVKHLRDDIPAGLKRVGTPMTPDEIQRRIDKKLTEHAEHLRQGLNVGSLEDCEERYRRTFENLARNQTLWEIHEFWAACEVVCLCVTSGNIEDDRLRRWVDKNRKGIMANRDLLIACARHSLELLADNAYWIGRTLAFPDECSSEMDVQAWLTNRKSECDQWSQPT